MYWLIVAMMGFSCYGLYTAIIKIRESQYEPLSKRGKLILGWALFIIIFGSGWWYNDTQFVVDDGQKYFVYLFESKDAQKNYRVESKLYRDDDGIDLSEVYWSNKGATTFYDDPPQLRVGEKIWAVDDEGREWYVLFNKEKVK